MLVPDVYLRLGEFYTSWMVPVENLCSAHRGGKLSLRDHEECETWIKMMTNHHKPGDEIEARIAQDVHFFMHRHTIINHDTPSSSTIPTTGLSEFGSGWRHSRRFASIRHRQGFFESQNLQAPVFVAKKIKKDADAFKQHLPLIHALWPSAAFGNSSVQWVHMLRFWLMKIHGSFPVVIGLTPQKIIHFETSSHNLYMKVSVSS